MVGGAGAGAALKIVHYLRRVALEDGGVVRAVLDLAGAMARSGHEVHVIAAEGPDLPVSWGVAGEPTAHELEGALGPLNRLRGAQLRSVARVIEGADALHLHTPWEMGNVQLASLARRAGVRYGVSVHGMLDDWCMAQSALKKRVYHALCSSGLLSRSAFVHCTARGELEQAQRWFPARLGVVVPLILDLSAYDRLPGPGAARERFGLPPEGSPVMLFLSRLHPKKGVERFIDAAALLRRGGVGVTAVVAGSPAPGDEAYAASLARRASDAGLGDSCRFVGFVSGDEKLSLIEAASVMAVPTSQENFGFVFPESLACGTAVVTTKGVDIWPELEASGGAVIVENDAGTFASAIGELLSDPARLRAMGERGGAWVRSALDGGRVSAAYERMYAGQSEGSA